MKLRIETSSIDTLTIRLFDTIDEANMPWLRAAASKLREQFGDHLIDLVPSYTTLMLHYDMQEMTDSQACERVQRALAHLETAPPPQPGRLHEVPVWYHPSVGPDLLRLARQTGLTPEQVAIRHCSREYQVFTLGFAPGFAYMGLVEEALAIPRLATPRRSVPTGSVGIAERQTAIYPLVSPGGWNLLGRTPVALFDRTREGYSLLQPGDRVRFIRVEQPEFILLGGDDTPMEPLL
ncbi:MAG TPA: 5-oxoprolinase subunit PxpB [Pseudomonas xinjiangensis]|uniref:5-oxoprolinase subunit PxpB n=2 Tax=root TaxID=1 RepID=A0A7V1BRS9_9GAMM|nr:5-oxoprolinase subunit PxpB [Halopseudomonas xinjiangensis]HEC47239.1 5-oxoprolinase subunit PxpB [Halopseudomonas xinjiangensis]